MRAGAATLAHGKIVAIGKTRAAAFRFAHRSRSGSSRREMGENGGTLVSSGRKHAGAGRRLGFTCRAIARAAIERTRRPSFVRPEPGPTGYTDASGRFPAARWQSEILFYRYSEIRRRAVLVNTKLHPDLVLCLHFNAEGWGDPSNPTLIDNNHLHLLVNGSYLQVELDLDDERFEMVRRLLSRAYDEELPIADTVATSMAKATGLPPYQYPTTLTTTKVDSSGYVYARNLLATRLYRCPVVYCEPYVMNSKDGFARIQAGDYDGTKQINGVDRKSIFREYADSVAEGLAEYYRNARGL